MRTHSMRNLCRRATGTVLIDIDQTVIDWARGWSRAMRALVGTLQHAGLDREALLQSLSAVHRSQYSTDAAHMLATWAQVTDHRLTTRILRRAARRYQDAWRTPALRYAQVDSCCTNLRRDGWRIVGYTESPALLATARLAITGGTGTLDGLISTAASSPAQDESLTLLPSHAASDLPVLQAPWWPKGYAASLTAIVDHLDARPDRTWVVGDHTEKDIAPAAAAGLRTVWARYGTRRDADDHAWIERLAHWSDGRTVGRTNGPSGRLAADATVDDPRHLQSYLFATDDRGRR